MTKQPTNDLTNHLQSDRVTNQPECHSLTGRDVELCLILQLGLASNNFTVVGVGDGNFVQTLPVGNILGCLVMVVGFETQLVPAPIEAFFDGDKITLVDGLCTHTVPALKEASHCCKSILPNLLWPSLWVV